ncbi:MAG: ATP-binding protein [Candidatus Aenigmarchaeota archaeon]|nr:ATP-binding protein [Candidatus Aenigmarchaeota archaeon]
MTMASPEVANNYYMAAKRKLEEGDDLAAMSLFEKAAYEYIDLKREATNDYSRKTYDDRKNDCLNYIKQIKAPKKQRISDGNNVEKITYNVEFPQTDYSCVAGMKELKEKIDDLIITPLMKPEYAEYDLEQSSGTILYGPPGCGKTHIIRSIPGEIKKRTGQRVGIIDLAVSDILDQWVGSTEKHIKAIFETAKQNEPCIIFFDEIEGIGMSRSSHNSSYGKRFVDELLKDISKIREENKRVYIIGATNHPASLDPALIRPGRFDEAILISPPDFDARKEMFELYVGKLPYSNDIDYKQLALLSEDFSGADIKKVCRDAGKIAKKRAIRNNTKDPINQNDLLVAIENTYPSVYHWYDEMEKMLKKGKLDKIFAKEIVELIESSKKRRFNNENCIQ